MCDTKNEGWCVKEKADNVCVCEWVREAKSEREGERFQLLMLCLSHDDYHAKCKKEAEKNKRKS